MILDPGDGRRGGDGAYQKSSPTPAAHEGEVVAVAGSSAQASGGTLNHPAMATSLNVLGSMVIDVRGNELDAVFLDDLGAVRDSFSIVKPGIVTAAPAPVPRLSFALSGANPARGGASFALALPHAGRPRVTIVDAAGRRIRSLKASDALEQRVVWDGRDQSQRTAPSGVYFGVLEFAGARRVARLVWRP